MNRNISVEHFHFFLTDEYSQWYPSDFTDPVSGRRFHCCEQWMMFKKAELFGDSATAEKIMAAPSPSDCKNLGREVSPFDPAAWDKAAPGIVLEGNLMKFSQNPELWAVMDASGDRLLVEAASYDRIWGIGLGADDAVKMKPEEWGKRGKNLLGKSVTATRSTLRLNPEMIAAERPWPDARSLTFRDHPGQRTLRFTAREVAASLGVEPERLADTLRAMGEGSVAMSKPGFLKGKTTVARPASELLAGIEPRPIGSAPARARAPQA